MAVSMEITPYILILGPGFVFTHKSADFSRNGGLLWLNMLHRFQK